PDRVPFEPKLARIRQANEQLAKILGHSIQIELDGALLPQSREGADDLIARLVEDAARDLDELAKENEGALAFARAKFERLTVRYAPVEAASRERRWRQSLPAKLDASTKTIDVVCAEAVWHPLDRGAIAAVLYEAYGTTLHDRYAGVMPDALPRGE